jgi:hypothetical protein
MRAEQGSSHRRLCERSEAIQLCRSKDSWIASSLRSKQLRETNIVDPALLLWRRYGRASSSAALGTGGGNN